MNYIKLLIILFLLNTSLFSNIDLSQAEKEFIKNHPTITVHNELNWPPYNFNKNGKPLGFSIDYMNLLALKLGIKVKYISGPDWSEFMGMIKDKKIDVMLNIIKTQDRNKVINFTNYYLQSKKAIFTNIPNIQTLDDLNGKTVAVPKDFFIHKFLEKNYPNIKLNIQKNVLDCIIAVMEKQADAIVLNFGVAKYLSEQNGLSFKYITITKDKKLITQLNIGTAKNIPILRDLLQKAMDSLSDKEIQTIHNTWLGVNQTDTKKTSFISTLNNKSQNYLKTKKVIKMCNNPNWEPIEFAQDNDLNNMSGIAIDTIKLLEKKLDVKFENVPTKSWGESQQFLKEKKCDILPCAIATNKRKEYANFTKSYLNLPLAIFTTKDKNIVSGLDEIMDKPWTRQKGSGLITKLKKDYPNMNIIETKGDKEALQYVNSGKAYFTIATLPVASHVISKYMLNDLHIAGYTGMVYNLSMAVRDDDKILLNILDKTLENLSKEESKQIMRKWVTSSVKESVADYSLIWKILIIVFIIILFLAYRHYILKKSNIELQIKVKEKTQDLQKLNKNLEIKINEEVNENLKTQKRLFKSEKMASMGEMIGNIAHQWRQPLSVISTGSTGMKMQKKIGTLSDEELFKTCDIINDNAQYLSKTIDDFRNFIIGDRTKTIFILKDDINSFLNLVDGSIKSNNINMILDLRDDIKIDGYANELIQCLINIFNNAKDILIEKAEEDRLIFISTFIVEDKAVIKIKDNGGGIPKDIINKIFEPYFTTKHKSQGTGLGLHMAYKLIVDGMGGTIEINNVEYEYNDNKHTGAEFTILLPMS